MASKFFEHFVAIVDAMNALGGTGLWDEADGFYYDRLHVDGHVVPLPIRSMVGLLPLCAVEVLDQTTDRSPAGLQEAARLVPRRIARISPGTSPAWQPPHRRAGARRLLAIPSRERLERVLRYMLDENEFLSPYGIRSVSRIHEAHPFVLRFDGDEHRLDYAPGESTTGALRRQLELARADLVAAELSCSSRRSNAITISTATSSPSSARPARGGC